MQALALDRRNAAPAAVPRNAWPRGRRTSSVPSSRTSTTKFLSVDIKFYFWVCAGAPSPRAARDMRVRASQKATLPAHAAGSE
jgi:hypothetical protein